MSSVAWGFLLLILALIAGVVVLIVRGLASGQRALNETRQLQLARRAAGPLPGLVVRPLAADDRKDWERHWAAYCDFYGAEVPESTTETTWSRILDPASGVRGFGAFTDQGVLIGFAHIVLHPHTWSPRTICYLEDLYVSPTYRGRDIGYSMISFLWKLAEEQGWGRVYWHTETTNAAARRLYDRFRPADGYVRYTLTL